MKISNVTNDLRAKNLTSNKTMKSSQKANTSKSVSFGKGGKPSSSSKGGGSSKGNSASTNRASYVVMLPLNLLSPKAAAKLSALIEKTAAASNYKHPNYIDVEKTAFAGA